MARHQHGIVTTWSATLNTLSLKIHIWTTHGNSYLSHIWNNFIIHLPSLFFKYMIKLLYIGEKFQVFCTPLQRSLLSKDERGFIEQNSVRCVLCTIIHGVFAVTFLYIPTPCIWLTLIVNKVEVVYTSVNTFLKTLEF